MLGYFKVRLFALGLFCKKEFYLSRWDYKLEDLAFVHLGGFKTFYARTFLSPQQKDSKTKISSDSFLFSAENVSMQTKEKEFGA